MHIPRKPGFLRAVTENVKYAVVCASRPTKVGNDTPILEDALPGIIHLGGEPKTIYWTEPTGAHAQRAHTGMAILHRLGYKHCRRCTCRFTIFVTRALLITR